MNSKKIILGYALLMTLGFVGCSKEDNEEVLINLPQITTSEVTNISQQTAVSGGIVSANGGADIVEQGICWGTSATPTVDNSKTSESLSSSSFVSNLTNLQLNTTYYVRAYAKNKAGVGYGDVKSFKTASTVTLTLQPGSEGKDGCYNDLNPTAIGGTANDIDAMAWTNSGVPVIVRSVMDFDLSSIAQGTTIKSAKLSLYNNPNSVNNSGMHSDYANYGSAGADNVAYLRRITSTWSESTICWQTQPLTTTTNQITIPASTNVHQSYENIDVTVLIQDIVNNKSTSFGMMLILQTESYYRGLIFASSDNSNAAIRPKLVITY